MDNVFVIYDSACINPNTILQYANSIHNNIQLDPTHETKGHISFLDFLIIRKTPNLEIDIFYKPTTTDTTINYFSNHPLEHKLAAYRYYIERMLTLPLTADRQLKERKTILLIAWNNNIPKQFLPRLKQQIQQKMIQPASLTGTDITTKWATLTYASPRIRKITNLFKHTNVRIDFKSNNSISQLMKPHSKNNTPTYSKSGIYKLTCSTYKLAYVGETSRNLKLRFQEHMRYIRNNNPQSAYVQHILQNQHEYGTLDNIMTLLKPLKNNTMLIPYEQLFIQSIHQEGRLIAEQHPGEPNLLFQLIIDPSHTPHDKTSGSLSLTLNT